MHIVSNCLKFLPSITIMFIYYNKAIEIFYSVGGSQDHLKNTKNLYKTVKGYNYI